MPEGTKLPYKNILVVTLFSGFDARKAMETEIVRELAAIGTTAVASTSMMNSKTPVTRATFVDMVDKIGADALLLSQVMRFDADPTVKDMRPERSINVRPTYYFNVYSVETTEYLEPQSVQFDYKLALLSEIISVESRSPVWGIQSDSNYLMTHDQVSDYSIITGEAQAIVSYLKRDGIVAK